MTWEPFASRRGEVINGGFGLVLDGTQEAEQKAKMMLSWDVSNGVSDPLAPPPQWPCPPPRKQSGSPAAPVSPLQPPPGFPSSSDGLFPAQPVSAGGPGGVARVPACACACALVVRGSSRLYRHAGLKGEAARMRGQGVMGGVCRWQWNGEGLGSPALGLDLGGPGEWRGGAPAEGAGPRPEGGAAVREWLGEVGSGRKAARGGGRAEATVQGSLRTLGLAWGPCLGWGGEFRQKDGECHVVTGGWVSFLAKGGGGVTWERLVGTH